MMGETTGIEWTSCPHYGILYCGMAQTAEGAKRIAAAKSGVSVAEYDQRKARGLKWCIGCEAWEQVANFGSDSSRYDGLAAACLDYRRQRSKELYAPVPQSARKPYGPPRDKPREGDKRQARKSVNLMVRTGRMVRPGDLPCFDCGHTANDRRHEYDHFMGYAAEFHLVVQAVCTRCHTKRELKRGRWGKRR